MGLTDGMRVSYTPSTLVELYPTIAGDEAVSVLTQSQA